MLPMEYASSCLRWLVNFIGKGCIIYVGMRLVFTWNGRMYNFCKQRAECFYRFLVIVSTEHGPWYASFKPEKLTDRPRLVKQSRFQVPQKTWEAMHVQTVCTRCSHLSPLSAWEQSLIPRLPGMRLGMHWLMYSGSKLVLCLIYCVTYCFGESWVWWLARIPELRWTCGI